MANNDLQSAKKVLVQVNDSGLLLVPVQNSELWNSLDEATSRTISFKNVDLSELEKLAPSKRDSPEWVILKKALVCLISIGNAIKENLTILVNEISHIASCLELRVALEQQIVLLDMHSQVFAKYLWVLGDYHTSESQVEIPPIIHRKLDWISRRLNVEGAAERLIVLAAIICAFFLKALGCFLHTDLDKRYKTVTFEVMHSSLSAILDVFQFSFSHFFDKPDEPFVHQLLHEAILEERSFIQAIFINHRQIEQDFLECLAVAVNKFCVDFGYNQLREENDGHGRGGDLGRESPSGAGGHEVSRSSVGGHDSPSRLSSGSGYGGHEVSVNLSRQSGDGEERRY